MLYPHNFLKLGWYHWYPESHSVADNRQTVDAHEGEESDGAEIVHNQVDPLDNVAVETHQ